MKVLVVDDGSLHLNFKNEDEIITVPSKMEALSNLIQDFDSIIVNSKFNNKFVDEIRKIKKYTPIFLVDVNKQYIGMESHSHQINGYYTVDRINSLYRSLDKVSSRLR